MSGFLTPPLHSTNDSSHLFSSQNRDERSSGASNDATGIVGINKIRSMSPSNVEVLHVPTSSELPMSAVPVQEETSSLNKIYLLGAAVITVVGAYFLNQFKSNSFKELEIPESLDSDEENASIEINRKGKGIEGQFDDTVNIDKNTQILINGKTKKEAMLQYYRNAADAGHSEAQSCLGRLLLDQNPKEGRMWLKKAAKAGDFSAIETLCQLNKTGASPTGVTMVNGQYVCELGKSSRRTMKWTKMLADQQINESSDRKRVIANAQYEYAKYLFDQAHVSTECFYDQKETIGCFTNAIAMYEKASGNGNESSHFKLFEIYLQGITTMGDGNEEFVLIKPDQDKALELAQKVKGLPLRKAFVFSEEDAKEARRLNQLISKAKEISKQTEVVLNSITSNKPAVASLTAPVGDGGGASPLVFVENSFHTDDLAVRFKNLQH